jgi:hypothetical protein
VGAAREKQPLGWHETNQQIWRETPQQSREFTRPFLGDVGDAIRGEESLGFVHLDWCSTLGRDQLQRAKEAASILVPGGVLAMTWLSAREKQDANEPALAKLFALRGAKRRTKIEHLDWRLSYWSVVVSQLKKGTPADWQLIFIDRYNSGRSPMMTIALAFCPVGWMQAQHRKTLYEARGLLTTYLDDYRFTTEEHPQWLRDEVLYCFDRFLGEDKKDVVCALYNIKKTTLSAWLAHRTMGTYESRK